MSRATTVAARSVVAVVLAVSLAACSDDEPAEQERSVAEPTPNEIMEVSGSDAAQQAERATRRLSDAIYEGTVTVPLPGGSFEGSGRITITGDDTCEYALRAEGGGRLILRLVDGEPFLRAAPEVWTELLGLPKDDLSAVRGKWMAPPAGEGGFDCYTSSVVTSSDNEHCFEGLETGEVDGTPARIVQCAATEGGTHKLYISALDEPVILRRVGIDDEAPFDFTLADSDTGVSITEPPESDVFDRDVAA